MTIWMVHICSVEAMFKTWLKLLSLKASRTVSKIDDVTGIVAGVDEECGYRN